MASSSESAELKLVSSIRYKLAAISNDEKKLSEALESQLPSLLEKAGSQHKAVRDETFKAFVSVKTFVKPPGVVLPVAALIQQYKRTNSPIVKQLDLGLIREGLSRLPQLKRRELLPIALSGISKESNPTNGARLFNVFLRLLMDIQIPGRGTAGDLALRDVVGLSDSSDRQYVTNWLGKLFLLRQDIALASENELAAKLSASPSGLDKEDVDFLRNQDPNLWQPGSNSLGLPECKLKAVSFLASGAFTDNERYLPIICAAGSADSRISSVADDALKKVSLDLENEDVVQRLFTAHNIFPTAQRMQILKQLSKSTFACTPNQRVVDAVKADITLTTGEEPLITGLEALRLHQALLGFLSWIARNGPKSTTADTIMRPGLIIVLKDYILAQGWPTLVFRNNQSQFQDEQRLRANAYETIGILAPASGLENKAKESLLKWLFDSLVSDATVDVVVYIESALGSMMSLFKSTDSSLHRDLEVLLLEYMNLPEQQTVRTARHVAVRFANNCLPYNNIKARWMNILALAGGSAERRDVLEQGQQGLDPWWITKLHPEEASQLPDWTELARFFFDAGDNHVEEHEMDVDRTSRYTLFSNDRVNAFPIAIRFVRHTLLLTALSEKNLEMEWESRLETLMQSDPKARRSIKDYLKAAEPKCILLLLNAALDGLRDHPDIGAEDCCACLADILSFAPSDTIISTLSTRAQELLSLRSYDHKVRQLVSKVFGILAPWDSQASSSVTQLRELLSSTADPSATLSAQYQCSLTCLSGYLSRATYFNRVPPDMSDLIQFVVTCSLSSLMSHDKDIQNAAMDSLAQLWAADIGWPSQDSDLDTIINHLMSLATRGHEKAIRTLGRLAIPKASDLSHNGETTTAKKILDKLFGLSETKTTEVHFAIGEAISAAIARWDSKSVQLDIDVQPSGHGEDILRDLRERPEAINATLDKLLNDCKATKPSLIKASVIWLFCIIQYCSELPSIQSRLRNCQVAFMRLLTARDELVQETASRGLSLVYEKGDESLKGDLVKDLVSSFTDTKANIKVDGDTQLFDPGALRTSKGKSITSYQDIINLATEVGDQSLVYKFMALATNAATWTARSAFGRFGLTDILSDAELDPKIYPKLFRYRFDPNENVRKSMGDIWKAIVKDQTGTISAHFDAIMADLLVGIVDGREWRVRQASCAAIVDLISGQPFPKYSKYYQEIWQSGMRVMDDQKDTVRDAATNLCLNLTKTLVAQLQENGSSPATKSMISHVLPSLLSFKGIESTVPQVRSMAIKAVLGIVMDGGDALKPFIPTIIIHFLGILSTIEPEEINYVYQRFNEEDREGLDRLRSTMLTRSPLFACIVNCLRFADEDVMKHLAPQLVKTMKSALGMQTKIGCGEVLNILVLRHSIFLAPYTAVFVNTLDVQILDHNNEVSKSYAKSAAYLLRSANHATRGSYTKKLVELYFKADEDMRRQKVADAVLAIAKFSPDAFTDLESRLLPFAYFAKHDTDEYVSAASEAAWSQHAGGHLTIKRFVMEILALVSRGLASSRWALQHGAAFTTASMITALCNAAGKEGQLEIHLLQEIWPMLDKALALKSFKGKERVVAAFPRFMEHGKQLWRDKPTFGALSQKVAIREAKRNNDDYRPYAFEALAEYAAVREDLDMYTEVTGIVGPHLTIDEAKLTKSDRRIVEAALKAVLTAYSRSIMREEPPKVLEKIASILETSKLAFPVARDTLFAGAIDLMDQASNSNVAADTNEGILAARWFHLLIHDEEDVLLESHRMARAKAILSFATAWENGVFGDIHDQQAFRAQTEGKVKQMQDNDRSLDVKRIFDMVLLRLES